MITSLIEMTDLPNFDHMDTLTIKIESCDIILLVKSSAEIKTS